ncbi:E3 ubiquitin-protein ligase ATL23-like [Abrus precatorius]|uniref:RING-type E3 ubiquitin transferase n=1 Tax=Abrus precatorius TaxID=3816 RepID=A0A8B8LV63_ABRPR|nr:E3 ubiquitin-protein ligase ATL23-like [Abrus precatorius]
MIERGTNGGKSMSITDLEKLPCYDYVAKDNTSSPVDCAVCLENLITGDKCRLLPMCKHSFHARSVDTWLLKTPICPICRSNAASHSEDQVIGISEYFIEPISGSRESLERGPSRNVDIELIQNPTLRLS